MARAFGRPYVSAGSLEEVEMIRERREAVRALEAELGHTLEELGIQSYADMGTDYLRRLAGDVLARRARRGW